MLSPEEICKLCGAECEIDDREPCAARDFVYKPMLKAQEEQWSQESQEEFTFKERCAGCRLFIRHVSEEELVEFMAHQQEAIDGLTKNNESFSKAYVEMYKRRRKP